MRAAWCAGLGVAMACTGGTTGVPDGGDGSTCGDAAPEFSEVIVEDAGEQDFGGTMRPSVQVAAQVTDADGDLHQYTAQVYYTDFTAGPLPDSPDVVRTVDLSDETCGVESAKIGLILPVGDNGIPADTAVKFGLVILDASGRSSNGGVPIETQVTTPAL